MNLNSADSYIPAEIKTSLDLPPLWGRLGSLSPGEAELVSHFELPRGKVIALSFQLGRSAFEEIRARIKKVLRDEDGYYNYSLVFLDPAQAELLRAAIAGTLPPSV
ncbi:MAG: hypothetical protein A2X31_06555 [Elusimicrobia bacterium GWB2_63_22]|nr:MAG: hypothetical protein A2X31_06555 [Elusimicrobia bacterium GWB2_63_22]